MGNLEVNYSLYSVVRDLLLPQYLGRLDLAHCPMLTHCPVADGFFPCKHLACLVSVTCDLDLGSIVSVVVLRGLMLSEVKTDGQHRYGFAASAGSTGRSRIVFAPIKHNSFPIGCPLPSAATVSYFNKV